VKELDIELPGGQPAKLIYLMDYPKARDGMFSIAWLQQRKIGIQSRKAAYDADLPKMTKALVEGLVAREDFPPDVVLLPASGTRLFAPYLDKLREMKPELVVVDGLFQKAAGFEAGKNGQTFDDVVAGIVLTGAVPKPVADATRVLILDDIFNSGNTAGAMIARVRPSMAGQPQVAIACPLYVPLEKKPEAKPTGSG
jgi:hypoxanthine phosphoribosyltransferase